MTGRTTVRRTCLALLGALAGLVAIAALHDGGSAEAATGRRAATEFNFGQPDVLVGDTEITITGRVTAPGADITWVRANLRTSGGSGDPLPEGCGVPPGVTVHYPSGVDAQGNYTFHIPIACASPISFSLTLVANAQSRLVPRLNFTDSSTTYSGYAYSPPPTTTTTTTTTEPGDDPPPGDGDGSTTTDPSSGESVPGTPTTKGTGTTAKSHKVTGGLRSAPKSPAAAIPALPGISGSRIEKVNPHIADGPPDTYDPTLDYSGEQDAMAQGKTNNNLAGASDDTTKRVFNTRLIAGCLGGAMVAGLFAAQIVLLNRRGRELDDSLPRID